MAKKDEPKFGVKLAMKHIITSKHSWLYVTNTREIDKKSEYIRSLTLQKSGTTHRVDKPILKNNKSVQLDTKNNMWSTIVH